MLANEPRQILAALFEAAITAADPLAGMAAHLPPKPKGRTVVVGAGKGAAQMVRALESLWDGPLSGVVVTRYGYGCDVRSIEVLEAAHPVPDAAGMRAAQRLFNTVGNLSEDDLVLALISGGGSSLLPSPPDGFTIEDEVALNESLLASGLPISAMNTIRKHFSRIKGGRLAAATKARVVSFVVSDIPGDNPAHVASGPTIPDASSRHDALNLISQYRLRLPAAIVEHIGSSKADAPLPNNPRMSKNSHRIVASARTSLQAAASRARALGINAVVLSDAIEGEARDVALVHAAIAREIDAYGQPFQKPVVLLSGGETTVKLRTQGGKGGRSGEFALAAALAIEGHDIEVLAADTDGIDGSENNAGAFADGNTIARLRANNIDARSLLHDHDTYSGFAAIGDLFETGPTGVNVNDFRALLIR
jgi:hydroxypyruvate reductase